MRYKIIPTTDIKQVVDLREYSFAYVSESGSVADMLPWLAKRAGLGGYDGAKLATQLIVFPLAVNVFGVKMKVGGIGWVSTYPEYRTGGHTKGLLLESLKMMRSNGQVLSMLAPFSQSFYRHFGWEVFFESTAYKIPADKLALRTPETGKVVRFSFAEKGDWFDKVKDFQRKVAGQLNGQVFRDDDWWARLESRGSKESFAASVDADDAIEGYIRYLVSDHQFKIKDFYTLNRHADSVLWGYIQAHASQIDAVVGHAPAQDSFGTQFMEQDFERTVHFEKMVRIVDVAAFLEAYPFNAREKSLYVAVSDKQAEWNDAIFAVKPDGTVARVATAPKEQVLRMGIGPFSALMMGFHPLAWYVRNGDAVVEDEALAQWQKALPVGFPSINDHF